MKGCVFISLYNFLNSLDITLEKNIRSYNNSFFNNFVDELKNYLAVTNFIEKLPANTLFTLDRFEGDFAVCENRNTGEMIDIPHSLIDSFAKDGDILRFNGKKFQIDSVETQKQKEIISDLIEENSTFQNKNLK